MGWNTPLGNLQIIEILKIYEGVTSFLVTFNEKLYFGYIHEVSNTHETWMVIPVSEERVETIKNKNIPLRVIFKKSESNLIYKLKFPIVPNEIADFDYLSCDNLLESEIPVGKTSLAS